LDPGTFDFGNVDQWALGLGPAERADVIVDFSGWEGKTIILYNDAPAPVPANDPRNNYYTCDPDQVDSGGAPSTLPGYGPNTRTIMQIRVANAAPATPYDVPALESQFDATTATVVAGGVFAASQETTIVPQAAYGSAYGTTFTDIWSNIFDNSLTFTPIGGTAPGVTIPFQAKALHDEMSETYDDYGRMQAVIGLEMPRTQAGLQNFILYNFVDPPTEVMAPSHVYGQPLGTTGNGIQIWKITHNGVDAHPLHFHEFEVQLINRVAWDNNVRWPDPNEIGWKETVRMNPLQDIIVALRPIVPTVPFDLPNSVRLLDPTMPEGEVIKSFTLWDGGTAGVRPGFDTIGEPIDIYNHYVNFGAEFVWHCHILAHEEMDMMRPIAMAIAPRAPSSLVVFKQGSSAFLVWADNSLSETSFTIERARDVAFTNELVSFTVGANVTSLIDTTIRNNVIYYYRVQANNLVGDTYDYSNPNVNEGAVGFPTIQADSAWSDITTIGTGTPPTAPSNLRTTGVTTNSVTLAWNDNSINEAGFLIQRATNGGFSQNVAYILVGQNVNTFVDTTVASNTRYYYRVLAFSSTGGSAWSNSINVRTL
jgi:FtsP/CotA-like multicopper oxidase with cupredoxin domain